MTYSASSGARHNVLAEDQADGSFMTCQNCHNTHTTSKTYPLVNPDDPSTSGVWMGTRSEHCLTCHDGALPTAEDTSHWVSPPLGSGGTTVTADIKTAYSDSNRHGAVTGDPSFLRAEMGFFAGDVLECSACHEPHGAANTHNLRGDVSSADGGYTQRGLIVYDIPESQGGGHDLRYFCKACHDMPDAEHPSLDISTFPVDCTACHRHILGAEGGL